MSEERELNGGNPGGDSIDVESMLRRCSPGELQVNRDALFFEAGFAAGSASRRVKLFWPGAAAAMLLMSLGLGTALYQQIQATRDLRGLLAAAENPNGAGAASSSRAPEINSIGFSTTGQATSGSPGQANSNRDRMFSEQRMRHWQRLASAEPLPPGKLTALGWEPGQNENGVGLSKPRPSGSGSANHDSQSDRDPGTPRQPPTYLELMRRYQQG